MRILVLFLAAMLAGCVNSSESETGASELGGSKNDASMPDKITWSLENCQSTLTLLPASAADLAPHLPDGFVPVPLLDAVAETDVPVDPVDGNIGVETLDCESGYGMDAPVSYVSYYSMVRPPAEFERDVTFHFVKWDVVMDNEIIAETLTDWGVPVVNGGASTATFQNTPAAWITEQTASLDGASHVLSGLGTRPYPTPDSTIAEFTETENGMVEWYTDITFHDVRNGPVLVNVAAGNILADVVGTGPIAGVGFIGTLSFNEGTIWQHP